MVAAERAQWVVGERELTPADVVAAAEGQLDVRISEAPVFRARLNQSRAALEAYVAGGGVVYAVTTGVGESVTTRVAAEAREGMARNIVRMHGCGTGALLDAAQGRALLITRIAALAQGGSAIRPVVLERLVDLLVHDVIPAVPSEGSVGASGDLTPLSYVAAVLSGDREVWWKGEVVPAAEALAATGLEPVVLWPKESLAIMNGTSMMTGLACLALAGADRLTRLSAVLTAMASDVSRGNAAHFDDRIFACKPHPGQRQVARWVAQHLAYDVATHVDPERVQDRYSIRCAPHVTGVLADALPFFERTLAVELNGVNDNPIVDPDTGGVLHGGNFYGGHVAFVMDALKAAVAGLADLHDRQLLLLVDPLTNGGLPANLVAPRAEGTAGSHGFKAMQITTSALAAEALKLTMPAASFSRSTESHNQDKVSMGTIAARDALRVVELTERVLVIQLIALAQAAELRGEPAVRAATWAMRAAVRETVPFTAVDRRHDLDIVGLVERLHAGALPLPEGSVVG